MNDMISENNTTTMTNSLRSMRIFICYAFTNDFQEPEIVKRLIGDLQERGAEIVTDRRDVADNEVVQFFDRELRSCQYLILIQTSQALQSLRVQAAVNIALNLVSQQQMKEVVRFVVAPSENGEGELGRIMLRSFDASKDYARARDRLLLELNLLSLESEEEETTVDRPQPELPANPALVDRPPVRKVGGSSRRYWIGAGALLPLLALLLVIFLFHIMVPTVTPLPTSGWVARASSAYTTDVPQQAIDGNLKTRWTTGHPMRNGDWFTVDMGKTQTFSKLVLDATNDPNDYPRGYQVFVSDDNTNWSTAIATGSGSGAITTITVKTQHARFITVVQTGNTDTWWWSIDEFFVYP